MKRLILLFGAVVASTQLHAITFEDIKPEDKDKGNYFAMVSDTVGISPTQGDWNLIIPVIDSSKAMQDLTNLSTPDALAADTVTKIATNLNIPEGKLNKTFGLTFFAWLLDMYAKSHPNATVQNVLDFFDRLFLSTIT